MTQTMSGSINDEEEVMMGEKGNTEATGQSTEGAGPHLIRDRHHHPGEEIALTETGGPDPSPQMIGEWKGLTELETTIDEDRTPHPQTRDLLQRTEDAGHLTDESPILPRGRIETGEADMIDTTDLIIDEKTAMEKIEGQSESLLRTERQSGRGS